jgi:5-hydroxyisourate hydrolase
MSKITTHVLDTVTGKPAAGIRVHFDMRQGAKWVPVSTGETDSDGRFQLAGNAPAAIYCISFQIESYLKNQGRSSIYPEISITFSCTGENHYHLPLLLSNNSYTTYRGS